MGLDSRRSLNGTRRLRVIERGNEVVRAAIVKVRERSRTPKTALVGRLSARAHRPDGVIHLKDEPVGIEQIKTDSRAGSAIGGRTFW